MEYLIGIQRVERACEDARLFAVAEVIEESMGCDSRSLSGV